MERFFKLKENGTNVRTEIIAGVTTFFTMAYIIFVNPQILSTTGMDSSSVLVATCIASAVGTLLMGLLANYPFALAPGMGLNAFFTYTVCGLWNYTWQAALAAVFISGIVFIIITVSGLREAVIRAIPRDLKYAISGGIGMFIALIGFLNAGIVTAGDGLLSLGDITSPGVLLAIIGIAIISVLMVYKVKGALLIGIIATTLLGFVMGVTKVPETLTMGNISLSSTFMKMDFGALIDSSNVFNSIMSIVTVILAFTLVDMFDTIGTLIGTGSKANMLDKDGNLPRGKQALMADSIATVTGSMLGTSTVTTYVESSAGISEGGRTGLTAVVVAILFLASIVLAPVAGIIPSQATAPALIIVGVLMMSSLKNIEWDNFEVALPSFMVLVLMPFAYSISDGIAAGFIFYTLLKLFKGKGKEVHPIMYVFTVLFIVRYILISAVIL